MEGSAGSLVPCRLFQDRYPDFGNGDNALTEVRLADQQPEEFLHSFRKWADVLGLLFDRERAIFWIATDTFLSVNYRTVDRVVQEVLPGREPARRHTFAVFTVDYPREDYPFHQEAFYDHCNPGVYVVSFSESAETARLVYSKFIQLMAHEPASHSTSVSGYYEEGFDYLHFPLSAGLLAVYLDATRHQGTVQLAKAHFSEEQCLVLSTVRDRPMTLPGCSMDEGGIAFFQAIGEGRGPKELDLFGMEEPDPQCLYSALRTTTSLTKLTLSVYNEEVDFAELLRAVGDNRSLVELDLTVKGMDGAIFKLQEWCAGFGYLKANATLKRLSIDGEDWDDVDEPETEEHPVVRAQAVLDMVKENKVIESISFGRGQQYVDQGILEGPVYLRLKANQYRPRFAALASEETNRLLPLLSHALAHREISSDPRLAWMLLSMLREETVLHLSKAASEAEDAKSDSPLSRKKQRLS